MVARTVPRVKAWRGKLARLVLVLLFSWGMLEGLLRLTAPFLGPDVCNELVRSYSNEPGGIYFFEPRSKLNFPYPNDHKRVAVNGRIWHHDTDERAFRNPPGTPHEILIFGDSFLYGHGIEEPQTAVAQLRNRYHWKVYNMARQGDSIWQEYILFRLWFDELKPKHIIICPFGNDFWDIEGPRTKEDQLDPPEFKPGFTEEVRANINNPDIRKPYGNWWTSSYCYRLVAMVKRRLQHRNDFHPETDESRKVADFDREGHYYTLLFEDMLKRCRAAGCTVDMVYIDTATDTDYWREQQLKMGVFFKDLCARNQVPYYSTRELLKGHDEYVLPNDGHLNPKGNEVLAEFIARECPRTWSKDGSY